MSKYNQLTPEEIYRKGLEDGYMRALDFMIANLQQIKYKRKEVKDGRKDNSRENREEQTER